MNDEDDDDDDASEREAIRLLGCCCDRKPTFVSAATFLLLFSLSFLPAGDQACCSADFTAYKSTTVTSIDAILYQPYSLGFTLFLSLLALA